MKFSIIVPTFNRKKLLIECLNALLNQDYPKNMYEVLVIDDGSNDGTFKLVHFFKKKYSNLRYFQIQHSGPGPARNFGLSKSRGKFIAFTDDDCIVDFDWLKKIELAFKKTGADAVGGSIINPIDKYISNAQYILNFSSWFPEMNEGLVRDIPTANIAYKKKSIIKYSFEKGLLGYSYEDSIFNYILFSEGKKIFFYPGIKVKHYTWKSHYGLKKFFRIQKRSALGFLLGGYKIHGSKGKILIRFRFLNLFCPRLIKVFLRCASKGYFISFLIHFPLILAGEFYKSLTIFFFDFKQ